MENSEHIPVMLAEVLAALRPRTGRRYVDGTLGGAGHAWAILRASAPDGWLFACDRDGSAIEAARRRLSEFEGRFELRAGSFCDLAKWIEPGICDGVLLDLGISSIQLADPRRGFSLQSEGPLDMRMDINQSLTARELVNQASADELARVFWEYGGERQARRFARAIERARARSRFETTGQLAAFIEHLAPRRGRRVHPATRVFQAIRAAVNRELEGLQEGLMAAWTILKPGGRLAVITFNSAEDRIAKKFGRDLERDYQVDHDSDVPELRRPKRPELRWVSRKAVVPSAAELADNPRARSAQLRVMEKLTHE